jgi:two-component system, response regulator YesN
MGSVLIVDDEPLVRVSISSMIDWSAYGIDAVHTAADGAEALQIVRRAHDLRLVILDLVMPTMDGVEFLRRLPEADRPPGIVVLSSHDEYAGVREAFRLGVDDYLLKSDLEPELLLSLVRDLETPSEPDDVPQIQRHNLIALQRTVLREVLQHSGDANPTKRLSEVGIDLSPPIILLGIWVREYGLVKLRYDTEGLERFHAMLPEYVAESVERRRLGVVVPMDTGHVVAVLHSAHEAVSEPGRIHRLEHQIRDTLQHYLNVQIHTTQGAPLAGTADLAEGYRRIAADRPMTTRSVARAKAYLQQHYREPSLSLEAVSELVGVSRSHLSAQFHKDTGQSFTDYLTTVRMEAAKQLLAGTDLKVYEVADRVGYANPEHFSRVFKRETGVAPGSFAAIP